MMARHGPRFGSVADMTGIRNRVGFAEWKRSAEGTGRCVAAAYYGWGRPAVTSDLEGQ